MTKKLKVSVMIQAAIISLSSGLLGMVLILVTDDGEPPPGERATPSPMWHPPVDWTGVP